MRGPMEGHWLDRVRAVVRAMPAWLPFLAAWLFLNAFVSVRYPGGEPAFWYLLPSFDVTVLLVGYWLCGVYALRPPALLEVLLVLLLLFVRLLRIADGVTHAYLARTFALYSDAPLILELGRLLYTTLPLWKFCAFTAALVLGLALLIRALWAALHRLRDYTAERRHIWTVLVPVLALIATQPFARARWSRDLLWGGALAASAGPRVASELWGLLEAPGRRRELARSVVQRGRELASLPHDLAELGGRNVYLFVIESYGQTVLEQPQFAPRMSQRYVELEQRLGALGFYFASGRLDSPTYGGGSWLAHATLHTGIRVGDQLSYRALLVAAPPTITSFFRAAGYRTVLVQPGTTRPWPEGEFYGFDAKYYAFDFAYRGPAFGWAPMPDQYVLDFIRRHELAGSGGPRFISYALVSSHAPWHTQPPLVEDWSKLDDGQIYRALPPLTFPVAWPDLEGAAGPYLRSVLYDFDVLERYITTWIEDDALVVVLGDHQPARQVTEQSASFGVPVHVLSRRRAFITSFARMRGFGPGLQPDLRRPSLPMQDFLPEFLRAFSRPIGGGG